jgi:cellulose synthase/poly-beta-1,6-N-acetylglucosamine synthase-like glycosyltransferase
MDTGIALLLFLVAVIIIYVLLRWLRISVLSSLVLALFFSSIILALLVNPQQVYNNRDAGSNQIYLFIMALVGIVLIAYILYKGFTDKDVNGKAFSFFCAY